MLRFLFSILLMGCLSFSMAEDAPLPLDHPDAITVSEERRVSSKRVSKQVRGKHVVQAKKHEIVSKKSKQTVKFAKEKKPAHAPRAAKGKAGSKKAGKKR